MEKKEIELNEAQVENALYKIFKDSSADETFLKKLIRNTDDYIVSRIEQENELPKKKSPLIVTM